MRGYRFATPTWCALAMVIGAACASDDIGFGDVGPVDKDAMRSSAARAAANGVVGGVEDAGAPSEADAGGMHLPPPVTVGSTGLLLCGNAPCACNNGIDDDADGVVDGFDVECTGALDDDEASFATGIPGDNRDPKWQDCFFDGNSGAGDDRCRYPTECLTGELPQDDEACATTEACRNNCLPLVPNGCDCFGCCEVRLPGGQNVNVTLGASCSLETIGDAEACPPCTPSDSCANECGECELCPGKSAADLPASCAGTPNPPDGDPTDPPPVDPTPDPAIDPPAPEPTCEGGTTCAAAGDCASNEFCSLGCCLAVIR